MATNYPIRPGYTIKSFTDATGAPGKMKCIVPATYTLQASASSFCAGSKGVQFALSSTENGRRYQLYRDGMAVDNAVLEGDGSDGTFGMFDRSGTYTARTIADDKYCAIAMDGTLVVIENPLPDNPAVKDSTRNCPGTVTLSASSPDAMIDWYVTVDAASSVYTGASYTTPEVEVSTTYYAQARIENTGCLSARVPVLATVITEGCCHAPGATGVTFAAFNPCTATFGATWTLTDSRDSKQYKVKYMPDGHWWMDESLRFGNCTETSLKEDNSATAATVTPTVAEGYVGHCRTVVSLSSSYYYTWTAAMNDVRAISPSSAATAVACSGTTTSANNCRGVCPFGWHLPIVDEYKLLFDSITGSPATAWSYAALSTVSTWLPGGRCSTGGCEWSNTCISINSSCDSNGNMGTVDKWNGGSEVLLVYRGFNMAQPVRCSKNLRD